MIPTISLTPKQIFFLLLVIGVAIASSIITLKVDRWLNPEKEPEVRIDTLTVYQVVINEKVIPIFKTKIEKDTVYSTDTLIIDKVQYIAEMDTVVKDSLMTLRVQYISPSPLDKRSYFSIDAKVRERIITQTIEQIKEVTFNPDFFVEGSVRINTDISYFIGAGVFPISYKHLESSIKAGAVYNKGWGVEAEISTRIKF